jgi:hypothetical protein
VAHVQGESLKVIAVVFRRLLNSPATSALLVAASPQGSAAMFFRRKPKPPLVQAEELVQEAVVLIHGYWRDKDYRPSRTDLKTFLQLEDMLLRSYGTVRRIAIRMERRFHGEAETDDRKHAR